ncbi:Neuropeptide-Like Protein [Caenorhabditis elegans]|uniref:Neuropeptide-Like Protein n=1 Tax=Caenorhabditis elegans TaxID=6239 RepID=A0A1D3PD96_CAEEL|nr:Neuropeptide-Like Protein [Caenorhabditis elegans]SCN13877.1 Neuropeptide-Like Protein [Caenorhabditis elegans]|eukprot:NP_001333551.1 Uncharacterized protein CELE_F26G1.15 [Caenorhabditis elegans]
MTVFTFVVLLLFYFCNTVFSYYIQTKRFDYDPSPILMYNQMYSHDNWVPFRYEIDRQVDEDVIPNWESLADGGTMDKRVTADQINSLLKNAWLGR